MEMEKKENKQTVNQGGEKGADAPAK